MQTQQTSQTQPWLVPHLSRDYAGQRAATAAIDVSTDHSHLRKLDVRQQEVVVRVLNRYAHCEALVAECLRFFVARWSFNSSRTHDRTIMLEVQQNQLTNAAFFEKYFSQVIESPPRTQCVNVPDLRHGISDPHSKPLRRFINNFVLHDVRLLAHADWRNEARALVTVFLVMKGMIAEMGMFGMEAALKGDNGPLLPGLLNGISIIRAGHSKDVEYAVDALQRIAAERRTVSWQQEGVVRVEIGARAVDAIRVARKTVGMVVDEFTKDGQDFPFQLDRSKLLQHALSSVVGSVERAVTGGRPVSKIIQRTRGLF